MTVEEDVEDLLDGLTEYDDVESMLADLEDEVELDALDDEGEVFSED